MNPAYNRDWLYNLAVIKETKRWHKQGYLTQAQLSAIQDSYKSEFYHPNFIIRILLFAASLLALSGVTGLFGLMLAEIIEDVLGPACILYGVASFFILEQLFIRGNKHYKSGVTEALLYHACGFTITGMCGLHDFENITLTFISCIVVLSFAAIRYCDLVTTFAAFISVAGFLFYELFSAGEKVQQLIPFAFIVVFTLIYFLSKKMKSGGRFDVWEHNLILVESLSLILVYLAGNYLVVRELSIEFMGLALEEGQDIPFAIVFYLLTVAIPLAYLWYGIKNKDVVLLRVSLVLIAFSVFTFKYYYGFGHPEISLTVAGIVLTGITLYVLHYLRTMRNGFTRENLLEEKWGSMNVQAIIVSQTMGGNEGLVDQQYKGGGGEFGGGGATGNF